MARLEGGFIQYCYFEKAEQQLSCKRKPLDEIPLIVFSFNINRLFHFWFLGSKKFTLPVRYVVGGINGEVREVFEDQRSTILGVPQEEAGKNRLHPKDAYKMDTKQGIEVEFDGTAEQDPREEAQSHLDTKNYWEQDNKREDEVKKIKMRQDLNV